MKIEVKEARQKGEPDYTFLETLLDNGGVYREADGRIHLYWETPDEYKYLS